MNEKVPRFLYPWVFYLPSIPVLYTLIFRDNLTNSEQFDQIGWFIYPDFNSAYLLTLTIGNVFHLLIILLLLYIHKQSLIPVQKRVIKMLVVVASIVLVWDIVFGYFQFRGHVPPYPYIYGGMIWVVALIVGMRKFSFFATYNRRFSILYDLNPSGIVLVDEDLKMESANPAGRRLLQISDVRGLPFWSYLNRTIAKSAVEKLETAFKNGEKFTGYESILRNDQGTEKHIMIDGDFVLIDQKLYLMLIIRDVQSAKEAEETIRFLAYHDPLTKLPNRRSFYERTERELERGESLALLVLDLDGFKQVNDQYGHQVGDDYLIFIGHQFTQAVGLAGMTARVGGDEFYGFIRLEDTDLKAQMNRIEDELKSHPFNSGTIHIPVRFSLGFSVYPKDGVDVESLIYEADKAMYLIKKNNGNTISPYEHQVENN